MRIRIHNPVDSIRAGVADRHLRQARGGADRMATDSSRIVPVTAGRCDPDEVLVEMVRAVMNGSAGEIARAWLGGTWR